MKPSELSIGDWVTINDTPYQVYEISKKGWVHLCYKDGMRLPLTSDYVLDLIKPVPITEEILEKNGFSGRMYAVCQLDDDRQLQFYYHEHRLKVYWTGIDEYNNHQKVTDETFRCHCHYVHELQHALRLCKIEKEIEP